MSDFTTVYDLLIGTTIPALTGFSTKTEIVNPYDLEQNDKNLLRNGWGLRVGSTTETEGQEFGFTRVSQGFNLVLTREVRAGDHDTTPLQTATKQLAEDAVLARLDFENIDQITLDANIEIVRFAGRTAIAYLGFEGFNIVWTVANFNFELKETL